MTKTNGEATDGTVVITKHLTLEEKVDILIDAMSDIRELVESNHAELIEKMSNMELPWGDGYNTRDRWDS